MTGACWQKRYSVFIYILQLLLFYYHFMILCHLLHLGSNNIFGCGVKKIGRRFPHHSDFIHNDEDMTDVENEILYVRIEICSARICLTVFIRISVQLPVKSASHKSKNMRQSLGEQMWILTAWEIIFWVKLNLICFATSNFTEVNGRLTDIMN